MECAMIVILLFVKFNFLMQNMIFLFCSIDFGEICFWKFLWDLIVYYDYLYLQSYDFV